MNEPKPNAGTPEKASSLHEVDVPLVELERRMNEARDKCSRAYWMNRTWSIVERLIDEYADAKRAYGAAKERHITKISDPEL